MIFDRHRAPIHTADSVRIALNLVRMTSNSCVWLSCVRQWRDARLPYLKMSVLALMRYLPVDMDEYWIMRTEVTNEQYGRCAAAAVCDEPLNFRLEPRRI